MGSLGVHIENGVALAVKGAGEGYGCIVGVCNILHINIIGQDIVTGGVCLHDSRECLQIFSSADRHRVKLHIHGNIDRFLTIAKGQVQGLLTAECLNRCTIQSYHTVRIACRSKGSAVYRSAGQGIAFQCAVVVAQVDGEVLPCAVSTHCKGITNHEVFLCAVYIAFSGIKVICCIGQHIFQCGAAGILAIHTGDVVHRAVADTQTVSAVRNNNLHLVVHRLRIQIRHFHIEQAVLGLSITSFTVAGVGVASAAADCEIEAQSDLAAEHHTCTVVLYTLQAAGNIHIGGFLRNYLIAFKLIAGIGRICGIDQEVALCRCTVVQHPLHQALHFLGVLAIQNGIGIAADGGGSLQHSLAAGNQGQLHLGSHLGCAQCHGEYIAIVSCGHFTDRKGLVGLTVHRDGHHAVSGVFSGDICVETQCQVFAQLQIRANPLGRAGFGGKCADGERTQNQHKCQQERTNFLCRFLHNNILSYFIFRNPLKGIFRGFPKF